MSACQKEDDTAARGIRMAITRGPDRRSSGEQTRLLCQRSIAGLDDDGLERGVPPVNFRFNLVSGLWPGAFSSVPFWYPGPRTCLSPGNCDLRPATLQPATKVPDLSAQ